MDKDQEKFMNELLDLASSMKVDLDQDTAFNDDLKERFPHPPIGNLRPNPETFRDQFMPNYPIRKVDYNLNALSYYHFLGRYNDDIRKLFELIDRLLHRDLTVESTPSIEFLKEGDWRRHGECLTYDDIINLKANVKLSLYEKQMTIDYLDKTITLVNALSIRTDKEGVYAPDYLPYLEALKNKMKDLEIHFNNEINNIKNELNNINNILNQNNEALKKIVNNLYKSGAITSNDLKTFEFNVGRDIASGNINLFSGAVNGTNMIRTTKDNGVLHNYDIVGGID